MNQVDFGLIVYRLATTLIPLILAITIHEWAHVAMARFLGDRTGEQMGRLTLNPFAHIDPLWTVAFPAYFVISQTLVGSGFVPFFAAGKPAPYTPLRLDRRFGDRRIRMGSAELLVAFAGPLSNLVMAGIATVVTGLLLRAGLPFAQGSISLLVFQFALLNLGLFLFNLIPLPPLDGSKILYNLLPRAAAVKYEEISSQLSWLLLAVLFLGGARYVLSPFQDALQSLMLHVVGFVGGA